MTSEGREDGSDYRTVLFDLDGTLIDSEGLILASFRHTMREHLGEVPPDREWLDGMGTPLVVQMERFARDEEQARAMVETYLAHNEEAHEALLRRFPGVLDTLAWLRERDLRLGIVTSKLREGTVQGMALCGIEPAWFDAVVTASEPVEPKPDPAPVRLALERAGETEPARALFIGDTVWDLRAGRAAGTATAAALWGPFPRRVLEAEEPDHLLARVEDVRDLLGGRDRSISGVSDES